MQWQSYPTGLLSKWFGELQVGDYADVRGPKGSFKYVPNMCKVLGMIAGGTGITPMLQIVRAVLENPADRTQLRLIFANVNPDDILMKAVLDKLAAAHADQFRVYYVLNNPPQNWTGGVGFVSQAMIKEFCPAPADDIKILSVFYQI